jgi:hypothetical protein
MYITTLLSIHLQTSEGYFEAVFPFLINMHSAATDLLTRLS